MLTYVRGQQRFFDNLVAFLASVASLGTALEIYGKGTFKQLRPGDFMTICGMPHVTGIDLQFNPRPLLELLGANGWPSSIQLNNPPNTPAPQYDTALTGLNGVLASLISSAFVAYYETVKPLADAKFGTNAQGWPASWNFGRTIRNAFAHGGEIEIRNPSAASVTWRSLIYGPGDNGRQVLFQDLSPVEIILLMEEMDSAV